MYSTIIAFLSTIGFYSLMPVAAKATTSNFWTQDDVVYVALNGVLYAFSNVDGFISCKVGKNKPTFWCPSKEAVVERAQQANTLERRRGTRAALKLMGINEFVCPMGK